MAPVSTRTSSSPRPVSPSASWFPAAERLGWVVASLSAFALLWQFVAVIANDPRLFPGPLSVFATMQSLAGTGALWDNISVTLVRLVYAFTAAMLIGSIIGILLGSFPKADKFFDPWLTLFLNLPAIVTITLCLIWGGMNQTAIVTAVALNKIPNTAVTMREGTKGLSRDLIEMAQIYKFGWLKTLRHVTLPQLAPFFAAAARAGLALIWKIVLVVEAFGGNGRGVGYQIFIAFQEFDVATILAYALAFIIIVQLIESFVMQPLIARVNRWRR
jgi:NitT/TauT family transport system permease protein